MDRQVERGAGAEQPDVDVAAPEGRRDRVGGRVRGGGGLGAGDAHHPHEGSQREPGRPAVVGHHAVSVLDRGEHRDVAPGHRVGRAPAVRRRRRHHLLEGRSLRRGAVGGERERSLAVPAGDHAVGDAGDRLEGLDLQDVADLCALDGDGSGDHVRAVGSEVAGGAVVVGGDRDRVLEHRAGLHAVRAEELPRVPSLVLEDPLVGDRIDRHGLAGADGQHRIGVDGGHIAPHHLVRLRTEVVVAGDLSSSRLQDLPGPGGRRRISGRGLPGRRGAGRHQRAARPQGRGDLQHLPSAHPASERGGGMPREAVRGEVVGRQRGRRWGHGRDRLLEVVRRGAERSAPATLRRARRVPSGRR